MPADFEDLEQKITKDDIPGIVSLCDTVSKIFSKEPNYIHLPS